MVISIHKIFFIKIKHMVVKITSLICFCFFFLNINNQKRINFCKEQPFLRFHIQNINNNCSNNNLLLCHQPSINKNKFKKKYLNKHKENLFQRQSYRILFGSRNRKIERFRIRVLSLFHMKLCLHLIEMLLLLRQSRRNIFLFSRLIFAFDVFFFYIFIKKSFQLGVSRINATISYRHALRPPMGPLCHAFDISQYFVYIVNKSWYI